MTIATKKGDKGATRFFSGETVSKSHPRLEVYGTLDELVSALGLARSLCKGKNVAEEIHATQRDLFLLGAELATTDRTKTPFPLNLICATHVAQLDRYVADYESRLELPRSFVVPGGTPASAALDLARTICRRLERRIVALADAGEFDNADAIKYVNRLSDVCFLWARAEETASGVKYDRVK